MRNPLCIIAAVLCVSLPSEVPAQIPIEVYENPSNLKVLSPDISAESLREEMYAIGQQVGIRCSRCHDFEPDTPFDERDYASDAKELKRVAREMMLMVRKINETVSAIDRGPEHEALTVQCVTCHRGVSLPRQIDEVFIATLVSHGLKEAIDEYRELRESWYGMSAYDFTAWKLGGIAQDVVNRGDVEAGMTIHALNFELNPDDGSIYYHRAETYEKQGRILDAIRDYERALAMEPEDFAFLAARIADLRNQIDHEP